MKSICIMRDIYKALTDYETQFEVIYGVTLNEAMILCALQEAGGEITSTALAKRTGMAPSHTSKTIRTVEEKGLLERTLGKTDKRLMYFNLTTEGEKILEEVEKDLIDIPAILKPLFKL